MAMIDNKYLKMFLSKTESHDRLKVSNCNDAFRTTKIKLFDEFLERVTSGDSAR